MKLNELNKIEEGIVSSIKGMFSGQGGYQTQVQDIFIKDFVQDAMTSLNNGVKGGLIDPNVKSTGTPAAKTTGVTGNSTQQGAAPQAPLKATSTNVTFNAPGAAANKAQPAANAAPSGQQYMGKVAPNAGPATKPQAPVSPFATPTLNQPKTTVSANTTAPSKPGSITSGGVGMTAKESTYDKMNKVFESIINIDEAVELKTISDFMMDWFGQYMQGVNWQSSQSIVNQKLKDLQDQYPNNLKQNLTDLARIGLALSKTATPAGAPQEFSQAIKQQATTVQDLKTSLAALAKNDPNGYNELVKTLKPVAGV